MPREFPLVWFSREGALLFREIFKSVYKKEVDFWSASFFFLQKQDGKKYKIMLDEEKMKLLLEKAADELQEVERPYLIIIAGDNDKNHILTNCLNYGGGRTMCNALVSVIEQILEDEDEENDR